MYICIYIYILVISATQQCFASKKNTIQELSDGIVGYQVLILSGLAPDEIKEALADELKAERSKANAVRRQLETARAKLRVLQAPDRMVADGAELQVPFWATFLSSAAMFIIGAVVGKGGNARVGIKL